MHHFNRMGSLMAGLDDLDCGIGPSLAAFAARGRRRRSEPEATGRRYRILPRG